MSRLEKTPGHASVVPVILSRKRSTAEGSNRAPLVESPLRKLPIGQIDPQGWLRKMLELEKDGMIGNLAEISPWLDKSTSAWASVEGKGSRGWEELPYWLKGYGDLGYILNDAAMQKEARFWIDATLGSQREDGWFGPRDLLTSLDGMPDLWPHMVMLNVLQSFYEYTRDPRVVPFMTRYFAWQDKLPAEAFGAGYWPKMRMGDNIESVLWLYNRTGETWLLQLAGKMHANMARWDTSVVNWHNVNIAQGFRAPAMYYPAAGDFALYRAAERNYRTVMQEYGQFPGGGFAADENARPGFFDPRQGFETCGIVEFMHSFQMLTRTGGETIWSDRCEELAFNSLPAAMTADQKALHYLTCANQVQLDKGTKAPGIENGGTMFSYSPYQTYRCCQHNVSHGWPYYAEELWLGTWDDGLCASLYAPSTVKTTVGNGVEVTIREETGYPFDGKINFTFGVGRPATFPLYLRIPGWCKEAAVSINGASVPVHAVAGSFVKLERNWSTGDSVSLVLQMPLQVKRWKKNNNAVSISRGPVYFSLNIGERWERYGKEGKWPEWEVFPTSPWNYGLVMDTLDPASSFSVV
ncbi:MAG: glycoside hydrolase family 127 protein, partial [Bacteroidetes bacterium]|nr:glycoside hydrolase family 127 protein [Bacteroidota bacterium]